MDEQAGREALILVGGLGTRLRPVVDDRPKPLAEVAGRPFLEYLLEQLVLYGYQRAVLCVGYKGQQIQAQVGDKYGSLALAYSYEDKPLGTGGALRQAAIAINTTQTLVMNGDSFCKMDLTEFRAIHLRNGRVATMAVTDCEDRRRSGAVDIDASGRVITLLSRSPIATRGLINAGIYMLHRDVLTAIPAGEKTSLEDEVFPSLIKRGKLFAWRVEADFIDIGTPESYEAAQYFFVKR